MTTNAFTSEQKTPTNIDIDLKQREVRITWADGYRSVYTLDYLRQICPCAVCDELRQSGSPLCVSQPEQIPPCADLRAEQPVTKVGSYALQFFWADNHNTGIYSFDFLRAKSPQRVHFSLGIDIFHPLKFTVEAAKNAEAF